MAAKIAAIQVKVRIQVQPGPDNFVSGRGLEGSRVTFYEKLDVTLIRHVSHHRANGPPMHKAQPFMAVWPKRDSVQIVAP